MGPFGNYQTESNLSSNLMARDEFKNLGFSDDKKDADNKKGNEEKGANKEILW